VSATRGRPGKAAMAERLRRCREVLAGLALDGVIVSGAGDVRYLSGFRGDDTILVIGPATALICADARYWEQVREEVRGFELVEATGPDFMSDTAAAVAAHLGAQAVMGFQGSSLSYAQHRRLRRRHRGGLHDTGEKLARLRIVKDAAELAAMRRAAEVTDEALAAVVSRGLIGRREVDVAWDLRSEYHRLGADGEAFAAIVAAGAHGAQAHAIPGDREIAAGELVVIDTGARVEGYCSDITRTFAAGPVSAKLRAIYDIVLEAQLAGLAAVRAGVHGSTDVDAACRRRVEAAGYGAHFGHGTGHGVGLDIHEAPILGRSRGDVLQAGMVCTVEPGIYVEGLAGVRIEDTVLVASEGCERLTRYPKELQVVG
jgi:Xaa-Pro aminopeptidase